MNNFVPSMSYNKRCAELLQIVEGKKKWLWKWNNPLIITCEGHAVNGLLQIVLTRTKVWLRCWLAALIQLPAINRLTKEEYKT